MVEELFINVMPFDTRVAVVESQVLYEIHLERTHQLRQLGNIYRGRVIRILPGMQAAFVDIGTGKAAFLPETAIRDRLQDGQILSVQVIKEPLGNKGARLTSQLSIPSRYLVFIPGEKTRIAVSQKIDQETERERLKTLLQMQLDTVENLSGTYIIRTVAEAVSDFSEDLRYLSRVWTDIQHKITVANDQRSMTGLIHEELPLVLRAIRDLAKETTERILIDQAAAFLKAMAFAEQFVPRLASKLQHYTGERSLFDHYHIENEIEKALMRQVPLKSGAYLVFDQTEALTTIDVNTGGFIGHRDLAETILRTNLEATQIIARQIRLRNLGGIIIIDFIDMPDLEHRRQVLRSLERYLLSDNIKYTLSDFLPLGLVQMTRKRTRQSLERLLCESCSVCQGRGKVKSAETVCHEIFREIMRKAKITTAKKLLILAAQSVVERLLDEEAEMISLLEVTLGKRLQLQVEATYYQEQYDVIIL